MQARALTSSQGGISSRFGVAARPHVCCNDRNQDFGGSRENDCVCFTAASEHEGCWFEGLCEGTRVCVCVWGRGADLMI